MSFRVNGLGVEGFSRFWVWGGGRLGSADLVYWVAVKEPTLIYFPIWSFNLCSFVATQVRFVPHVLELHSRCLGLRV